jgi:hypothetical protein
MNRAKADREATQESGEDTMFREILAAVLIFAAIATASAAVPGLIENVALACNSPDCE